MPGKVKLAGAFGTPSKAKGHGAVAGLLQASTRADVYSKCGALGKTSESLCIKARTSADVSCLFGETQIRASFPRRSFSDSVRWSGDTGIAQKACSQGCFANKTRFPFVSCMDCGEKETSHKSDFRPNFAAPLMVEAVLMLVLPCRVDET